MTAERTCRACGAAIDSTDRRRRYCDDRCKTRYHRGARAAPVADPGIGPTEAATMVALTEARKLGTPMGQAALVLARRIDRSSIETGAGLAAMANRLGEIVTPLLADRPAGADPVDELSERRRRKLAAAPEPDQRKDPQP